MESKEFVNYSRKQVSSAIEILEKRIRSACDASNAALFRTNFGEDTD